MSFPKCDRGDAGVFMGADIGGTLVKLAFLEPAVRPSWCNGAIAHTVKSSMTYGKTGKRDSALSFSDTELHGTVHFLTFESDSMGGAVQFIEERGLHHQIQRVCTAGGGAHKYSALFRERLGIELVPVDELAVVVQGISWMAKRKPEDIYSVDLDSPSFSMGQLNEPLPRRQLDTSSKLFPFLLVNIGSGVSVVRVDSPTHFERISGTAIGGGTYWGLCQMLTGCHTFEDAVSLAAASDGADVNLLVRDIYGGDYTLPSGAVLPGTLTASFFAKVRRMDANGAQRPASAGCILRALTTMISQNICQIAYLNAQLQGTTRVVFTGNFLRGNRVAQQTIATNMQKMSLAHVNGKVMHAFFLEHEGYFGALGCLLQHIEPGARHLSRRKSMFNDERFKPRTPSSIGTLSARDTNETDSDPPRLDVMSCALGALAGSFLAMCATVLIMRSRSSCNA